MIRAVETAADRAAFAAAIAPWPGWRALLGRDLALWAGNPGAPVKLFLLAGENGRPAAALELYGQLALLCGTPDAAQREELAAFLRFTGTPKLRTPAPLGAWAAAEMEPLFCYALPAGECLPAHALPPGCALDTAPPAGEAAQLLFPGATAQQDAWYVTTNAIRNHGLGRVWMLRDQNGAPASTLSATVCGGEAYLQMGYTAPAARGRGLFAALITTVTNELAGQGNTVALDCREALCPYYAGLGFTQTGIIHQYNTECIV